MTGQSLVKRWLPKSLLGRSLMIIVMPLILLQVVSGLIFYETHWDKVTLRLARGVAGDIAAVVNLMRQHPDPKNRDWIFGIAAENMELVATFAEGEVIPNERPVGNDLMERMLIDAMTEYVGKPFQIDTETRDRFVIVDVQLTEGVLRVITSRKRLFSSTAYVFTLWMVGTSMILFAVATIFMRNQVKPIRRLAIAADNFGKGRDVVAFKPEGATEVRQAASAFLAMRERILRQIAQRTDMLSGVSHDLRTPLTRMKLALAMLKDKPGAKGLSEELQSDVVEMERMLEEYLAFARGEGSEAPAETDIGAVLAEVAAQGRRNGGAIDLHVEGDIKVVVRPNAFKRCVTNVIENAIRYADHVFVRAGLRGDAVEITVDDDGPGIPKDKREEVFRPFFRLDGSRNPETGGVGLGLSIARDVMRVHGGEIVLEDAPSGGLRARLRVPV